jgi:hypothetical protein
MAFDDFWVNSGLTSLALALVYDWLGPHLVSIADVSDVIYLRTLRLSMKRKRDNFSISQYI